MEAEWHLLVSSAIAELTMHMNLAFVLTQRGIAGWGHGERDDTVFSSVNSMGVIILDS